MPTTWTEKILLDALAQRYAAPAFAFLTHVMNGTGSHATRTIDAIAMGVWPSRGLDLHGFEIKTSRSDWLRELKNPAKADGWKFDYFWLVTPLDLVQPHEVPRTWGLIEARATETKGVRLAATKEAPKLKTPPLSRTMIAAMLRKVQPIAATADEKLTEYNRGFSVGHAQARDQAKASVDDLRRQLTQATDDFAVLHHAVGGTPYESAARTGDLVRLVRSLGPEKIYSRIAYQQRTVRELLAEHDLALGRLHEIIKADTAHTEPGSRSPRADSPDEPPRSTDTPEVAPAATE